MGSSATRGVGVEAGETWPTQLEEIARREGLDVEVANRASHGLALAAYAERVLVIDRVLEPDAYLLQLPIPGRLYVGINGAGRLSEQVLGKDVVFGWSEKTAGATPTRLMLTRGITKPSNPFHKHLSGYFLGLVQRNNPDVGWDDFYAFLRFWDANVQGSDLSYVEHAKELVLLQHVLTRLGKPYRMFEWIGPPLRAIERAADPFCALVDWSAFVGDGHVTAFAYLASTAGDAFDSLQYDRFGHLNAAGNRVLAEEWLLPELRGLAAVAR